MPTDQETFMQAYAKCHEPFVRYCSAVAYGKMDTQDLIQDVLLSAFQKWDSIEKKNELLHYLVRAARNKAISVWRWERRNAEITEIQNCSEGSVKTRVSRGRAKVRDLLDDPKSVEPLHALKTLML